MLGYSDERGAVPVETVKQEFHCASCGYQALVRIQPRGCPLCHVPSPKRAPWGGAFLAGRARSARAARPLVRA
jgi:hypothetical protein